MNQNTAKDLLRCADWLSCCGGQDTAGRLGPETSLVHAVQMVLLDGLGVGSGLTAQVLPCPACCLLLCPRLTCFICPADLTGIGLPAGCC